MHGYLEYLHRCASLARRLCEAGVHAWVAFGEHDEVKLADDEREALENCASVTLVTIAGAATSRSTKNRLKSRSSSSPPSPATLLPARRRSADVKRFRKYVVCA